MKKSVIYLFVLAGLSLSSHAITPMDAPLKEGGETMIECEYSMDEPALVKRYELNIKRGTYHYKVFVPEGYASNPEMRYPCLFVQSPGGNAKIGNLKSFAVENKWIVIMLVESKNGPSDRCIGNFLAAHDDAVKRLRVIEGYKVITGLSGAARESSAHCGMRPGFVGVILQGAGFLYYMEGSKRGHYIVESAKSNKNIMVYGIFGDKDSNKSEIDRMKKVLPAHTLQKFVTFNGGHTWAPAQNMSDAMSWIESNQLKSEQNRDVVKGIVLHKIFARNKGASQLEDYETCMASLMLIKNNRLTADADAKKFIGALLADKKRLESDPALRKELLALRDFKKAQAAEDKFRDEVATRKMSAMFLKAKMQNCIKYYQRVSSMHPRTESCGRAQARASALQDELGAL